MSIWNVIIYSSKTWLKNLNYQEGMMKAVTFAAFVLPIKRRQLFIHVGIICFVFRAQSIFETEATNARFVDLITEISSQFMNNLYF